MFHLVGGHTCNRNTLFPYNESVERHFQLIESIEKKIPLYPTRIWRTKPTELEYHYFREKEFQRQKQLKSMKRNFQSQFGLYLPLFQKKNIKKMKGTESQEEMEDDMTIKKMGHSCDIITVKEPELNELERYFHNTSPIPLSDHQPEDSENSVEEEDDGVEEEDTLKGEATEEDIEEEDYEDFVDQEDDLLKKFNGNYRNALSSGTPAEKEIKRAEANRRKRLAYKKRIFQKKLNDGFIVYKNEPRRSKSWNRAKTNTASKNMDLKCPPLDFVNFPTIHMKL
uniref:Uncharacterized protein n=1 Tax=Lepeophtheirus salmonis TaxID=72036 RepID=A0A0K2U6Q0_LEPSM